jgi:hypothetical protein
MVQFDILVRILLLVLRIWMLQHLKNAARFLQVPRGPICSIPPLVKWRHADPIIGLQLSSGTRNVVRCNFFRVPTGGLPGVIYQYSVSIFR